MENFWRTRKFRTLSIEWEKKLEDSGFVDSESTVCGDRILKQRSTNAYRQADNFERDSKLEYYCFVGYLSNNTIFPNELEKLVMLSHADGRAIKEIVEEIQKLGISRDRKTIRFIIRRWQMKWGIRSWSLRQMNLKKTIVR